MDLRDTPEEAAFRAEVRAFIEANLADRVEAAERHGDSRIDGPRLEPEARRSRLCRADVAEGVRRGGRAVQPPGDLPRGVCARAEAPTHLGVIGLGMAGPTIIAWGTDAQKERYLAKILNADEIWCQGFSEPDAGSDLAAARTRIEDRGDRFVVNGQKVWSSFAHIADFCILVGLGLPDAPRYQNLTYVVVDMHAPGVEVRPLVQITGHPEFNEIFFTDVEVPKENLLGEVGGGWQVAMTTLLHERGTLGFALAATLDVAVRKLIALAKERNVTDPILLDRIAREWVELQALKYTNYRALTTLDEDGHPRSGRLGLEARVVGGEPAADEARARDPGRARAGTADPDTADGYWQYQQLRSRGNTIEAGTSEILRNIVGERVLGLPRSR